MKSIGAAMVRYCLQEDTQQNKEKAILASWYYECQ